MIDDILLLICLSLMILLNFLEIDTQVLLEPFFFPPKKITFISSKQKEKSRKKLL